MPLAPEIEQIIKDAIAKLDGDGNLLLKDLEKGAEVVAKHISEIGSQAESIMYLLGEEYRHELIDKAQAHFNLAKYNGTVLDAGKSLKSYSATDEFSTAMAKLTSYAKNKTLNSDVDGLIQGIFSGANLGSGLNDIFGSWSVAVGSDAAIALGLSRDTGYAYELGNFEKRRMYSDFGLVAEPGAGSSIDFIFGLSRPTPKHLRGAYFGTFVDVSAIAGVAFGSTCDILSGDLIGFTIAITLGPELSFGLGSSVGYTILLD